jgi:hypothetical protein
MPRLRTAARLPSGPDSLGSVQARWKTGLEPATACLEGRLSQDRRSLHMNRLHRRVHIYRMIGERA